MPESIFVNEKEIKIKSVYITDFGVRPIGRESDEKTAIKTGVDELIFFMYRTQSLSSQMI